MLFYSPITPTTICFFVKTFCRCWSKQTKQKSETGSTIKVSVLILWAGLGWQLWTAKARAAGQEAKLGIKQGKGKGELITEIRKIPIGSFLKVPSVGESRVFVDHILWFWRKIQKEKKTTYQRCLFWRTVQRALHIPLNPHYKANGRALRDVLFQSSQHYLCRGGIKAVSGNFNTIQRKGWASPCIRKPSTSFPPGWTPLYSRPYPCGRIFVQTQRGIPQVSLWTELLAPGRNALHFTLHLPWSWSLWVNTSNQDFWALSLTPEVFLRILRTSWKFCRVNSPGCSPYSHRGTSLCGNLCCFSKPPWQQIPLDERKQKPYLKVLHTWKVTVSFEHKENWWFWWKSRWRHTYQEWSSQLLTLGSTSLHTKWSPIFHIFHSGKRTGCGWTSSKIFHLWVYKSDVSNCSWMRLKTPTQVAMSEMSWGDIHRLLFFALDIARAKRSASKPLRTGLLHCILLMFCFKRKAYWCPSEMVTQKALHVPRGSGTSSVLSCRVLEDQ